MIKIIPEHMHSYNGMSRKELLHLYAQAIRVLGDNVISNRTDNGRVRSVMLADSEATQKALIEERHINQVVSIMDANEIDVWEANIYYRIDAKGRPITTSYYRRLQNHQRKIEGRNAEAVR